MRQSSYEHHSNAWPGQLVFNIFFLPLIFFSFQICNSNIVWKIIFTKRCGPRISNTELNKGEVNGWKHLLRSKIENRILYSLRGGKPGITSRPFAISTSLTEYKNPPTSIDNNPKKESHKTTIKTQKIIRDEDLLKSFTEEPKKVINATKPPISRNIGRIGKSSSYSKSSSKLLEKEVMYTSILHSKSTVSIKTAKEEHKASNLISSQTRNTISMKTMRDEKARAAALNHFCHGSKVKKL